MQLAYRSSFMFWMKSIKKWLGISKLTKAQSISVPTSRKRDYPKHREYIIVYGKTKDYLFLYFF